MLSRLPASTKRLTITTTSPVVVLTGRRVSIKRSQQPPGVRIRITLSIRGQAMNFITAVVAMRFTSMGDRASAVRTLT